ncbi:MAG: helix-turn-helix transcriptional regulator [Paraburkholderia fungorum]|nr:helix-turn-helix transcriptional regulator [Paraburkholderia fungorum]
MKTAKELVDELSAAGMTQGQIADKTGITQATISRIQAGISEGRAANLRRLSELHAQHFNSTTEQPAAA